MTSFSRGMIGRTASQASGTGGGATEVPAAPSLVWVSDSTDTAPNFTVDLPSGFGDYRDAADGDIVNLEITDNAAFSTSSTNTLDVGEVTGDIVAMEATTLPNGTYWARARLKRGADYGSYSNVETKTLGPPVDTTAPVITSPATFSVAENIALSTTLTATDAGGGVTWSKTGGADAASFTLTSGGLLGLAAKDYETEAHSWVVQVTATDAALNATNQTITVTITDVAVEGTWQTVHSLSPATNNPGWSGYTLRQLLAVGAYSGGPTTGTKVRITLDASTVASAIIDACYVGHRAGAGDPYDYDGNQVQILFSGAAGVTVAAGSPRLSDEITFSFDKTKDLIIGVHFSGVSAIRQSIALGANYTAYDRSAINDAGTTNTTAYNVGSGKLNFISKVEVLG